ncbi:MAG: leucine-rich repeat protein [Ruminococcus sp.]|nr:leucine-rich repeat protein [Ruminococcus sp.]
MNKHVKVVAGVLALTLVFSGGIAIGRADIDVTAPVTASAYQSYTYGDFDYIIEDNEIEIVACKRDIKEAVIPAEIDGKPVKYIATDSFSDRTNLESVIIPDSVVTIGTSAFENCTALKSVTIPDSIVNIASRAFKGCTSLESVNLSKNIAVIEDNAFSGCTSLNAVVFPERLKLIDDSAFADCEKLSDVTIPESVYRIGVMAFENTAWLKGKIAENPLVTVNNMIIDATSCKGDVEIPAGITTITGSGFGLSQVTSVTIPDSVTNIDRMAFYGCKLLKSITIPASVNYIGEATFTECENLQVITIMNPNCTIYDNYRTLEYGIINAPENSTAKAYAEKYNRNFVELGEEIPDIPSTPSTLKKGDVNEDGYIDPVDASIILSYYAYTSTTEDKPVMDIDEFMNSDLF